MDTSAQIVCPSCDQVNRVPRVRLADRPRCGSCRAPLLDGHPPGLTEQNFQRHIERSDFPVVVDFWAPWCGPCRMMAPAFEAVARDLAARARLAKVNTEEQQALAARYQVRSIPTLILFRSGRELDRVSGALDRAQLKAWIERQL